MQEAGLIRRDPPEGKRARYILTDKARALEPLFGELADWGAAHLFADGETPPQWPRSDAVAR
jgi:DNA-binding HxlR family transcriptional regulator